MGKFFKKHAHATLNVLAVIFLAVIVGFTIYGVGSLTNAVEQAFVTAPTVAPSASFDLSGAAKLNLHGLPQ